MLNWHPLGTIWHPLEDLGRNYRFNPPKLQDWQAWLPGDSKCPFHPLVGGHLTPWKGHLTIPKRSLWITRWMSLSFVTIHFFNPTAPLHPRGGASKLNLGVGVLFEKMSWSHGNPKPQGPTKRRHSSYVITTGWFMNRKFSIPWKPETFIFRGYNPYIGGVKPSNFMWFWVPMVDTKNRFFGI